MATPGPRPQLQRPPSAAAGAAGQPPSPANNAFAPQQQPRPQQPQQPSMRPAGPGPNGPGPQARPGPGGASPGGQLQRGPPATSLANGVNPNPPRPQQPPQQQQQQPQRPPSAAAGGPPSANRPTPPSAASSSSSASAPPPRRTAPPSQSPSPSPTPSPAGERHIEQEDGVPLVAEVYENQRFLPVFGWGTRTLGRPAWSTDEGLPEKEKEDFRVPPGWSWAGEWAIDTEGNQTDAEGWSYSSEFTKKWRGSADGSLKSVRRRRHFRRRVPPAKSVKVALGLAGGARGNALTVGLVKNTLAVASNTVRSANNGYSVKGVSGHQTLAGRFAKPAGGNPSLAELYAKQTEDPAPSAASPAGLSVVDTDDSVSGSGTPQSSSAFSSASSTLTPASAAQLLAASQSGGDGLGSLSGAVTDSPTIKPKYAPFVYLTALSTGLGTSSGVDSLSTAFRPKLEKAMVRLWEFQRYYPIAGWSKNMLPTDNKGKGPWINDADGKKCESKENFPLTSDWRWTMDSWSAIIDSGTDLEGWSYAIEPSMTYHSRKGLEHFVRRRLWQREKQQRGAPGQGGVQEGPKKSYTLFFERLEYFKRDLLAEDKDDDLVALTSASW